MGRLGYSSITLTDLTETLPVFLTLESNLSNNIQKKNGSLYTPDFKTGDGVIITPSLFVGSEKITLSGTEEICYKIGNEQYKYNSQKPNIESGEIGVNSAGQLIIKQNKPESYEIDAFINDFQNKETSEKIQVKSRNKISIFVLEENSSYTAIISSTRDFFNEDNANDITLTAQFYKGIEEVIDATYVWDGLTDDDSSSTDSNINGTSNELILSRAQVKGTEVISCTMKDNSTGLSFVATKVIRDYIDEYRADLLPSSSLILTPNNSSVKLTARVWNKTNIINDGHTFSYEWKLIKSDGTSATLLENTNLLNIDTTSTFPKENFTIACTITIDGKTTASAYQNITYSPIEYTVNVEPKQVWLNVDSEGNYSGEHIFNFKFQLLDKEKNPIPKKSGDGFNNNNNEYWSINVETSSEESWNYNLILTIKEKDVSNNSQVFEFYYTYLGKEFSEEVYVIKNYAGKDGTSGIGYTIDLSNEFHLFEGGEVAAKGNQSVEIEIIAKYGDEDLIITDVNLEDVPPGLNYSYSKENKVLTFSVDSDNKLTEIKPIKILITTKKDQDDISPKQWLKIFNYNINYEKKSYSLSFDSNVITYNDITKTYLPAQLSVFPLVKNNMGINSAYEEGAILYSYDNDNWNLLLKDQNKGYVISNYMGERIYIKLYHANAEINNNTNLSGITEAKKEFLLDEETIPILTSLDGIEIGGDNLLRWTKTMPIENNKWSLYSVSSDSIYQEQDGEFSTAVFNESTIYSYIFSPKEIINEEYSNKTFCFSCYAYFDKVPDPTDKPILACQLRLYTNFSDSSRNDRKFHKRIAELSARSVNAYPQFITKETIVSGEWIKIYQTFNWSDFIKEKDSTVLLEDCKYFALALYSGSSDPDKQRIVKIKKPKLELGNTPTEWSASPYDIDYTNIAGTNLIDDAKPVLTFSDSYRLNSSLFSKDNLYTLSWSQVSYSGNKPTLTWKINNDSTNTGKFSLINNFQYTFPKQNDDWYLTLTVSEGEITFNELKIEKGTIATGYKITVEQANAIAEEQARNAALAEAEAVKNAAEEALKYQVEELYRIPTIGGGYEAFSTKESFIAAVQKYNDYDGRINTIAGNLEAQDTDILYSKEGIQRLEKSIQVVTSTTEPYIKIQADLQSDSSSKTNFLKLTPERLEFWSGTASSQDVVAYMSNNLLVIKRGQLDEAIVKNYFNIGGLNFKITESGVGVTWDFNFNYAE